MSGKYDDYHSRQKYHGRRRNAHDFSHPKRDNDSDQRANAGSSGFDHSRIGGGGGIRRKHHTNRYEDRQITRTILNTIKDDDTVMNKDTSDTQERTRGSKYRYAANTLSSIGRVKQTTKAPRLAIGESNEEKTLLSVIPYCKLTSMNQNLFDIIVQFTRQYFMCFDKNRDELLAAYHPNALYSVSLNLKNISTVKAAKFDDCVFRDSRNLLHVEGGEKKFRMLHRGNFDIVAFIKKMSPTEHDSDSLKLDCDYFQPNMITFSIIGVFKEGKSDSTIRPFRNFQRTFICVPAQNNKMVIVNEQYTISNLTESQEKHYKEEIDRMQTTSDDKLKESSKETTRETSINKEQMKSLMIKQFSRLTGLNELWSRDILDHSNWDINAAEMNFLQHKVT